MVRPVELETDLQKLDSMPEKFLRDEFLQQADLVRNKILKKTKAKQMNGKLVTSEMLIHLANAYINSVNSGTVPVIESAWSYVCKEKALETADLCISQIDKLFNSDEEIKNMILDEKDWKGEIKKRLLVQYNSNKMANSIDLKDHQNKFEDRIMEKLAQLEK